MSNLASLFGIAMSSAILGAAVAVLVILRFWPRVTVSQVIVTPEAIARGIAAGGGITCNVPPAPPVYVDWSIIHSVVEANGYRLIAKHEDQAGVGKRH